MPTLEPYIAADDVWVLPSYIPIPGNNPLSMGSLIVNSFLIRGPEPILIDTGMAVLKEEFLSVLWSLVDPKELKWVLLTHDDADHTGALMEVLQAAPQAKVFTQYIGLARLETAFRMPLERVGFISPGAIFTAGGRDLFILRPPFYDSPATVAIFDQQSGVFFTADSFGAIVPTPVQDISEVDDDVFWEGFYLFNRLNHPWFSLVDPDKLEPVLENIRRLESKVIASSHAPMARGRSDSLIRAIARIPRMDQVSVPERAALDPVFSQARSGA